MEWSDACSCARSAAGSSLFATAPASWPSSRWLQCFLPATASSTYRRAPCPICVGQGGLRERPSELGSRVARAEVVGVGLEVREGLVGRIGVLAVSNASPNVVQPLLELTWFRQAHPLILSDRVRDGGEAYCPRTFIADIPEEAASPEMAAMFAADRDHHGYVNNWTKVYARRPDVLAAWKR